ncbi:MAG: SDR family oxidoreductase [Rhodocyclaceae bacterium]|nr:MAG: SDR family oxidoreductase [Rhodocyclaceae bacterium]
MTGRLQGKRILLTQSKDFMGPVLHQVFVEQGAEVIADDQPLLDPDRPRRLVEQAGQVDVLVANLAIPAPRNPATEVSDEEWASVFDHLVTPLPRLARAVLPQMLARGAGKILVMGSASALRGRKNVSTYSAARGAQLAWVKNVGIEVADRGVQVNAIAQNFVDNPTYFPPSLQADPAFQQRLKQDVPIGRLATPMEDAMFAVFLCSDECNFLVGQAFPFSGGWAV